MSNFIVALMMSTVVGLPPSFNLQPQTIQQLDVKQIQSCPSSNTLVYLKNYDIKVAQHNNNDEDPSDKAPLRGDGRRDS
ncbi:hypothetical protein PCC9214_01888 [Planktothrix tepida]|uniref:Uncharacterized protein n=2 Tax=Planktothrix TaxID=54304 RepID=A0A1J1LNJ3_9CYAN|nr:MULTISPECIES: hypothetical protein [Planktothrix]CAD5940481.1 hypothetical protein PCC9214_01888 [Planktothrix tepida]CAD5971016.1 hypothetical protein NO713_03822 [Planktothrix pseudagardhii]CUR33153.1 exported hypothetical protein [Planktothrix tepida PCC 9214]